MKALAAIGVWCALGQSALACAPDGDFMALEGLTNAAPSAFVMEMVPPVSKPFDLTLHVCGVSKAELYFDAIMPAHQHGMNYDVDVTQTSPEQFTVSNAVFHMPGLWELQVELHHAGARYQYRAEMMVP